MLERGVTKGRKSEQYGVITAAATTAVVVAAATAAAAAAAEDGTWRLGAVIYAATPARVGNPPNKG